MPIKHKFLQRTIAISPERLTNIVEINGKYFDSTNFSQYMVFSNEKMAKIMRAPRRRSNDIQMENIVFRSTLLSVFAKWSILKQISDKTLSVYPNVYNKKSDILSL